MSYGSNEAVEAAEDDYREQCAVLIAQTAAKLVAARDMGREEAISVATEWIRAENEADHDETGVSAALVEHPSASKIVSTPQIKAIAVELMDASREAADSL